MDATVIPLSPGIEGFGEFLVGRWPLLAAMALMLLVLLTPAALRAGWPGARLTALAHGIARVLTMPSRLLAASYGNSVWTHLAWMSAGTLLLVVFLHTVPLGESPVTRLVFTPPPTNAPGGEPGRVDIRPAVPLLVLVGAAVAGLLARTLLRRRAFIPVVVVAAAGIVVAAALLLGSYSPEHAEWPDLMGLVRVDPYGVFAGVAVLAVGLAALLAALPALARAGSRSAGFPILALLSLAGMGVAVSAADFLALCAGLILMLICNAVVLGMPSDAPQGARAAKRYGLTGLVAGGLFLVGVALLCSVAGGTQFDAVRDGLAGTLGREGNAPARVPIGLALTLAGLAWLVRAVPLHAHAPQASAAVPVPAVGFLAAVPVVAAFLVLLRLIQGPFEALTVPIREVLLLLGMASIVLGALASWVQGSAGGAVGHLAASLAGIVLVALSETAMPPLLGVRWATLSLVVMLVMFPAAGLLAMIACGGRLVGGGPVDLRAAIRRALASGLAFLLGLVALYASLMMLLRSGDVADDTFRRAMLVVSALGLVVAGARWLILFRRVSIKARDGAPEAARFAAAGSFLIVLAVVTSPVWLIDTIARAIELTWLK